MTAREPSDAGGVGFALWTRRQRPALIALLLAVAIYLGVRSWQNPVYVTDPPPPEGARAAELVDRLDPNTADWQTLAALPGMGEKHARDIVAYRERFTADHPGKLAFTTAEDMLRIRGIGVATLKTLEPHLVFPTP